MVALISYFQTRINATNLNPVFPIGFPVIDLGSKKQNNQASGCLAMENVSPRLGDRGRSAHERMKPQAVKYTLMAQDMNRAVTFYRATMGFSESFTSLHWSELRFGDAIFALHGGGDGSRTRTGLNLQFRGGKLVNHPINAYNDTRKVAELNNFSLPHPLLLLGVWPFYLVFIVFAWVLYSLFFRDRRPEHDGSSVRVGANIGTDKE